MSENRSEVERWAPRLAQWSERLRAWRMQSLVGALLEALEPLGPLGAQVLWIAQPTLGLLLPRDEIGSLARLLDRPDGMAWVREQLLEQEHMLEPKQSLDRGHDQDD
ncbi:MAG: hypothetical protein GYB65_08485 [Chloroflexi bacterium]|nr:hypothetical protein [Chloroflexota bacterium]